VPGSDSEASRPILVHDGPLAPVEELADLDTAQSWCARLEQPPADTPRAPLIRPLELSIASPDCTVFLVPAVDPSSDQLLRDPGARIAPSRGQRRADSDVVSPDSSKPVWIGFRFEHGEQSLRSGASELDPRAPADLRESGADWRERLLTLAAGVARFAQQVADVLTDPVTGLPGRTEFQTRLNLALAAARKDGRFLSLLLTNPDGFAAVNERFGQETGDEVIREIAAKLRLNHRRNDQVARFGGAIFASILSDTPLTGARAAAENVLRELRSISYVDGRVRLGFTIGVAVFDPHELGSDDPFDLIRRADQALNSARKKGGGRVAVWGSDTQQEETENDDRLSGIFTGDMAKDYRNMVLLWDSVTVMAAHPDFGELASQVVERLYMRFKPERVGIFGPTDDGDLRIIKGLGLILDNADGEGQGTPEVDLTPEQLELMDQARRQRRALERRFGSADSGGELVGYAIPLLAGEQDMGCLYLDGRSEMLILDSSDLFFLRALAAQLAMALDRARLSQQEWQRREQESERLRAELDELRRAIRLTTMEYRSPNMEALLATTRRVAATEATILITGESGTGKELLARTIHELSPRKDRPLVVVDCSAIATSLIDSELFGHERGAYTGAQDRRIGRLTEADGATVLLDEIGELPLEVQSKLLRFVQEKQVTPVGGTRPRSVDVRVIAATNRDLSQKVSDGLFREDLYYRLNVVRLEVPPLRERPDDILHLANHYLQTYAALYKKTVRKFVSGTEELLLRHTWPGNVRELQNRIMQAVILCDGEELGPDQLGTLARAEERRVEPPVREPSTESIAPPRRTAASEPLLQEDAPARSSSSREDALRRLRLALSEQIDSAIGGETRLAVPIGKWLSEDLLLAAATATGGVTRRGAALLGLPQTTYRRRLGQATQAERAGLAPRPNTWSAVRAALEALVRCPETGDAGLMQLTQQVLLEEVVARVPEDTKTGSSLLGVSLPTYLRRLAV
jgi:diguanylate cyclase (GGDEF)-like protein